MKRTRLIIIAGTLLGMSSPMIYADEEPASKPGMLILEDDFNRDEATPGKEDIGNGWTTDHMDLRLRERRLAGEKLPELTKLLHSKTANFPLNLKANQWYTLLVVVEGDVMRVQLDGKPIGEFQSEGIAHPTKRMITLAVAKSAWIDDVKIWKRK